MEFGVNIPTSVGESEKTNLVFSDQIYWENQCSFSQAMEQLGFDSIAVPDHIMTGNGSTECITTLTGIACKTDVIEIYTKTLNEVLRHGPLLAKIGSTIDSISGGRFNLGMGGGWHEDEAIAFGYDWPSPANRLMAMEETIEVVKSLWTQEEVNYRGEYYTLDGATCRPYPVQDPHPPIMVGGGGEKFTLRIAARFADEWNIYGDNEVIDKKINVLNTHLEKYDRKIEDIDISWFGRALIRDSNPEVDHLLDQVPRFKKENLPPKEKHLIGTPDEIIEDIEQLQEHGIDNIFIEFVDFPSTTGAEIFSKHILGYFE